MMGFFSRAFLSKTKRAVFQKAESKLLFPSLQVTRFLFFVFFFFIMTDVIHLLPSPMPLLYLWGRRTGEEGTDTLFSPNNSVSSTNPYFIMQLVQLNLWGWLR
jgi:hypothetical protein